MLFMPIIEVDMSKIFTVLLVFTCILPIFSLDLPVFSITDDSILRNRLLNTWFLETPHQVLSEYARIETLQTGERVQISVAEGREEFIVILARERMGGNVNADNSFDMERRPTGQFPGWAQGSWMLTRNKLTGEGTLIRIFLRSDQYTFVQFRPLNTEKCLMDVILYGGFITRSLQIAVPFERLYTMPLNEVLRLAGDKFPTRYFEPDPSIYRDNRVFVTQVREHLRGLRFADDGAIDENGNYVLINTLQMQNPASSGLNCSGFVKWLIDGMLRPITGERLSITPLSRPFGDRGSSFTVNWEERRDVFFGLDWIRNLAATANGTLRSSAYSALEEFEVRNDNFSFLMINQQQNGSSGFSVQSYAGFLAEAGFGIEGLRPLLYSLAVDDPYSFYLAAISNEIGTAGSSRGTPRLRQYFHVAALVPYFDEFGIFRIVVFESANETPFNTFRNRYPGHFINLVKIPVPPRFIP